MSTKKAEPSSSSSGVAVAAAAAANPSDVVVAEPGAENNHATAVATTKGNVETKKVEVKNEIDALTVELTGLVATAKAYVAKAPRGKEGAAAVDAINTEVGNLETGLTQEIPAKVTAGDLMSALDWLKASKEKVNGVITELTAAYEKAGKKLPKI